MKHKKALTAIAKLIDEVTNCCMKDDCDCRKCPIGLCSLCIRSDHYDDEDYTSLYNLIKERIEE